MKKAIAHFNGNNVQAGISQKHMGLVLNSKPDFNEYVNNKISESNGIIGIMNLLLEPNLDSSDVIYDKPLMNRSKLI